MEYKSLAEKLPDEEISRLLWIVNEDAILVSFERNKEQNYISVFYRLPDLADIKQIDFLADCIYYINGRIEQEVKNPEIRHRYLQYTVAKGYSEIWKCNPYV